MKKVLFVSVLFFIVFSANAQTSKELIGKWQLVKWTKNGKEKSIIDEYKTDQVFQVFKDKGKFESVVDDKIHKGSWKLSKDNKKLTIIADLVVTVDFTIDYFDAGKRIITYPEIGTLEYQKVTE